MNIFLTIIIISLLVLLAVVAYNMRQETLYRNKIRSQFGHADQDALLNAAAQSVRDGKTFAADPEPVPLRRSPATINPAEPQSQPAAEAKQSETPPSAATAERETRPIFTAPTVEDRQPETQQPKKTLPNLHPQRQQETAAASLPHPLMSLSDLENSELLWFDKRFDFMGYIALSAPQELATLPRLSDARRFQIIGCTLDGRFQPAEPIPGVSYQAFIVGLQAVSRAGLASTGELEYFARQVRLFAEKIGGIASITSIPDFLEIARPLDELCARVDQTIAIHLVSNTGILGTELRAEAEKAGFKLTNNGTFVFAGKDGAKYTIAALDGSLFTEALLTSQPYKGFSMLFDITRVPNAEEDFNEFMNLAVGLSGKLNLDLVDDQVQRLSTEWLKEVRVYVGARQAEMRKVGIEPDSALARRLFS